MERYVEFASLLRKTVEREGRQDVRFSLQSAAELIDEMIKDMQKLKKQVEYRIPKKAKTVDGQAFKRCPVCDSIVSPAQKFCVRCGQAIEL